MCSSDLEKDRFIIDSGRLDFLRPSSLSWSFLDNTCWRTHNTRRSGYNRSSSSTTWALRFGFEKRRNGFLFFPHDFVCVIELSFFFPPFIIFFHLSIKKENR